MASAAQTKEPTKSARRLNIKQAVATALKHFLEVFPDLANSRVMLEEVEETDRFFLVTVGYDVQKNSIPSNLAGNLASIMGGGVERKYKTVTIDAATGRVSSIKIRSIG
jgi:hypothetical protein